MNSKPLPIQSWLKMVRQIVSRQTLRAPDEARWLPASHASVQLELDMGLGEVSKHRSGPPAVRRRA